MQIRSRFIVMLLLVAVLSVQGALNVSAANTVFNSPTISPNVKPQNMVYQSPNLNIIADKWSYGLDGYIVNTSNLQDLIDELNANVSTAVSGRAHVSIYPNGSNLSDTNIVALRDGGWDELSLYYYDFFIIGGMPDGGLSPNVTVAENVAITEILKGHCNLDELAIVEITGVNMNPLNFGLYSDELEFLHKNFYAYKFIADLQIFVPAGEYYIDSYASNVLEMYDLQNIESDVNGFYVVLNEKLPAELIAAAEELPALRETAQQKEENKPISGNQESSVGEQQVPGNEKVPVEEQQVSGDQQTAVDLPVSNSQSQTDKSSVSENNHTILTNKEKNVEWQLSGTAQPEGFVPDATVTALNKAEIFVDFAYSGNLPDNTKVTVTIPDGEVVFREEEKLFLYYCNPDNGLREYVGEGIYQDRMVTFDIEHCSQYIITNVNRGSFYTADTTEGAATMPIILCVIVGVMACGMAGLLVYRKVKRQQ